MVLQAGGAGMSETKRCWKCKETKPLDQFYLCRRTKDGRQGMCRLCQKAHGHDNDYRADHGGNGYWGNRERAWKRYGITLEDGSPFLRTDYQRLSVLQGGVCALCGRHPPMWGDTLSVDHHKKTGLVRGLLCEECNRRAVGIFERCGRFGRRQDVNDLIRAYLDNPPALRLHREAIP